MAKHTKHHLQHHTTHKPIKHKIPDSNAMLVAIVAIVAVVGLVVLYSDGSITGEAKSGRATCVDSDGDDPLTFGAVQVGSRITPDMCRDAARLKEQICTGNRLQSPARTCPAGYTCVSGTATLFGRTVTSARCEAPTAPPALPACDDADGDGYQNMASPPGCAMTNTPDCDDTNAAVHPGATEVCGNAIDENCDGALDVCPLPAAETICNNLDDNSDGVIDEGCDDDNDNYCDASMAKRYGEYPTTCSSSSYWSSVGDDCDDTNAAIHPGYGITDACGVAGDGVDNDCDGTVDEGFQDYCDGVDNDCNGVVDGNSTVADVCPSCTDSDGGNNPTVGGVLTWQYVAAYHTSSLADSCGSSTVLNETICEPFYSGSRMNRIQVDCTVSGQTCIDPDGVGTTPAYCG